MAACESIATSDLSSPLLNSSEAKSPLVEQVDYAEATEGQVESGNQKTLQSPFEYTPELVTSRINLTAKTGNQRINLNRPLRSWDSSGYIYFAPTNPSHKSNQALNVHRMVSRRQLSYIDPPSKPRPRSLHRSRASRELRHEAERHAENCSVQSRSDSTLTARTYHSEPIQSKTRPWAGLPEQKGKIKEARVITIRSSPSKPQLICTPCRRAKIDPVETTTPVYPGRGFPIHYPYTPPPTLASSESVLDLGIVSVQDKTYDEAYDKPQTTWIQTTPSLNLMSTAAVRRVPLETPSLARADTPRPIAPHRFQLSEITRWIILELEASFSSIPQLNLRLDSPVILQICLPAGQRRVPRQNPPTLPLSRYSNLNGPLSSHPTHSPINVHLQTTTSRSPILLTKIRSLSIIFPHASSQLLSSLQATYLALRYISTIHLPSPSSCLPPLSYTETQSLLSTNMPYIPAKARAMLGLQIPIIRPGLPASWRWPELREWRERIDNLESKLRRETVRFIRMCEGSDLGKIEALVRAVGEIIEFEQESSSRRS